jgi:hypothetical protein
MAFARMQFPEAYRLNDKDLTDNKMAAFPRDHPFRDQQRWTCSICLTSTSFPDTATFCAHLFGKRHRSSLLSQLNRCTTCHASIGESVNSHVFTQGHLDARYQIFEDVLHLIMPYQDELEDDHPGTHM